MVCLALTFLILLRRPLPSPSAPVPPVAPPTRCALAHLSHRRPGRLLPPLAVGLPRIRATPAPTPSMEGVQEVHRRLIEWLHGMRFRELTFAGPLPSLPLLGLLSAGP